MFEWLLKLSSAEMWLYGIVAVLVTGLIVQWFSQRLSHALTVRRERHKNIIPAATAFRSAIDINAIEDLSGHQLHNALLGVTTGTGVRIEGQFSKWKQAVHEFRIYLPSFSRLRLNKAWAECHGGDEEHPDLFKKYCIKTDGPKILKARLHRLRSFGNRR